MKELEYPFDSVEIRRKLKKLKKILKERNNLLSVRVAVLSGSTVGQLSDILELFLLNQGIAPEFWEGAYNNYYEEAVFGSEELIQFKPDIIYVHTSVKNIQEWPAVTDDQQQIKGKIAGVVDKYIHIWDKLQEKIGCPIIQNNFEMLPYRVMGNMDRVHITGKQYFIEEVNRLLATKIREKKDIFLNDIHYLSASYGLDRWFEDNAWYFFKYPFSPDAFPIVANNIANIIKSYFGKNKKAIIVDLDNTLWKGLIGEDGTEGILLGIETPEGMLYQDFQQYLKDVKERGIVLNICSKNEDGAAQAGLNHPSSVLRPEDFTIITCNWNRKSENIQNMAKRLNLTTDSFIFIDDNPAEQEEVQDNVEGIKVLQIHDPLDMRKMLDKGGYFEITSYSMEDVMRTQMYDALKNMKENAFIEGEDYNVYLQGLEMKVEFSPIISGNLERATQLINKTNQFNLTGKRLNKGEVAAFAEKNITICGTLWDKFGNNGLVSVILGQVTPDNAVEIYIWVMSCRVFKRNLEYAMFDRLVEECKKRGINKIIGRYIATNKNMPVAKLYKELQFKQQDSEVWEYTDLETYKNKNSVIRVEEGKQI